MNLRPLLGIAAMNLTLGACAHDTVPLNVVLDYGNCSGLSAGVREVTLDEVAKIRGMTMFGGDDTKAVDQAGMPKLIAISRGEQPTAGYSLSLKEGRVQEQLLHVEVEWKIPATDAITAQMMSHPCLVLGLPDTAPSEVIVATTEGEEIGRLTLTP